MLRELFFESASKPYYLRRENLMSPEKQNPILSKNLADLGLKKIDSPELNLAHGYF
jgi:hypothetical protein